MFEFTLPSLTQDHFSSFYGQKVPRADDVDETIVYPGQRLPCSSRSRTIKKVVKPKHVFITRCVHDGGTTVYNHRLLGSDNVWSMLPKRLHTVCFPKIHLGSIPAHNRVRLQLTDSIYEELPFVPDDFFKLKQAKAERPGKPVTRRFKRKRQEADRTIEDAPYIGWYVNGMEHVGEKKGIDKQSMLRSLQKNMDEITKSTRVVTNPFEDVSSLIENDEVKKAFATVVQFVHHYGRQEFRMHAHAPPAVDDDTWDEIKDLL